MQLINILTSIELFGCYMAATGTALQSGMKSKMAIAIAAIAFILFVFDFFNNNIKRQNWNELFYLALVLVLYFITGLIYPHSTGNYDRYSAYLLMYGAMCVPAAYIGIRLARERVGEELVRLMPYFVLFVSLVTFYLVISSSLAGSVLRSDENGTFSYQSASYYLAFCYSYCFFYVFLKHKDKSGGIYEIAKKCIMFVFLIFCGIGCLLGGGRGAFVYIVVATVYLLYRLFKLRRRYYFLTIILLIVASIAILFLSSRYHVLQSAGFTRVAESLTTDYNRFTSWKLGLHAFWRSPVIGNGLGSVWWTIGYYSHNIFVDLLSETGLIGTMIFVSVILRILKVLIKKSYYSNADLFYLLLFLGHISECLFSGYWLASPTLFFAFGYVFALPKSLRSFGKRHLIEPHTGCSCQSN